MVGPFFFGKSGQTFIQKWPEAPGITAMGKQRAFALKWDE